MAIDPYQLYVVIAQIAAAFAGFGSLASGLGRRGGGDDSRVDANRLSMMLAGSLSVTLLGLLPATIGLLLGDEHWSLRTSAAIALIVIVGHAPKFIRRLKTMKSLEGFSLTAAITNGGSLLIATVAFTLCILELPVGRLQAFYLLGLMGMLASTAIMFSRVIISMLRPHNLW